jgi:hypothetical protein
LEENAVFISGLSTVPRGVSSIEAGFIVLQDIWITCFEAVYINVFQNM